MSSTPGKGCKPPQQRKAALQRIDKVSVSHPDSIGLEDAEME